MIDNALPIVGSLLQRAYNDDQRRRRDALADAYPEMAHMRWPKRRSSKRRPIPGVFENAATDSEG